MFNKKGEIGETMTWVVATVAVISIMVIFLFSLLNWDLVISSGDIDYGRSSVPFMQQTMFSVFDGSLGGSNLWELLSSGDFDEDEMERVLDSKIVGLKRSDLDCQIVLVYAGTLGLSDSMIVSTGEKMSAIQKDGKDRLISYAGTEVSFEGEEKIQKARLYCE